MFKRKVKDDNIIASRELLMQDFKQWPFKTDMVIIQKRGVALLSGEIVCPMPYITVIINGKLFGLNGASVDHLKLKSIIDSKYYIKGISVNEFIEIGINLK